ncbi:MAG: ATP-binding cassette domain-containing protein, partial [Cyclobacteriaceae bacterium]
RTYDVGLVPQSFNLNSTITILDNVSMISKIMGEDNWIAKEKAEYWLSRIGLQAHLNDYPIELGLLEFKKVGIAKAMIKKPEFLILDELYACLSNEESNNLFQFIYDLNKEYQMTIIQATRKMDYCKYSDTVYQIKNGRSSLFKSSEATAA